MIIRKLYKQETKNALELVKRVFMEFEAPEYSSEGVKNFISDMESESFIDLLTLYGAFDESALVGVAATRNEGGHISLFFVDSLFHKRGIGRLLFNQIVKDCSTDKITVNSSPYAVEVYRKLGFSVTAEEQSVNGIRFIPMVYML